MNNSLPLHSGTGVRVDSSMENQVFGKISTSPRPGTPCWRSHRPTGLAKQNPSGDFRATGYLIVSGMQPPSPRLLREYLAETRRRQGLNYPGGEPLVQAGSAPIELLDGSQAPFPSY